MQNYSTGLLLFDKNVIFLLMAQNKAELLKYDTLPDPNLGIHIAERRNIRSGPVFEKHWHDHLQLILFIKGTAVMHCHQGAVPLQAGDVAFINSGEVHYMDKIDSLQNENSGLDFIILKISPRFLQGRFLEPVVDLHYVFVNCIRNDEILDRTICHILEEYETRRLGWEIAIRAHVLGLLSHLIRHHVDQRLGPGESRKQQDRWFRMGKVLEYIEKNSTEEISLKTLADIACQSESHFCRSFKKITGCSTREYLMQLRIQKAKELILETENSIAEIGYSVGFSDNNYFSRAFRKIAGCPPREYRKRLQTNERTH